MEDTEKIITDDKKLLVATIEYDDNQQPVAVVKHGKKSDHITLDSFASQLYGKKVHCVIKAKKQTDGAARE